MIADALRRILEPAYSILGVPGSAAELEALLRLSQVDLVLLDLALPDTAGLELVERVRKEHPALKILVLTMFVDRVLADACLQSGADGFIPKIAPSEELAHAIEEVLAGRQYLSPRLPKTSHDVGLAAMHPALWRLTPRQQRIFRLLGEGARQVEIAAELRVSRNDITWHVKHIMQHLGVHSRRALVKYAVLISVSAQKDQPRGATRGARPQVGRKTEHRAGQQDVRG